MKRNRVVEFSKSDSGSVAIVFGLMMATLLLFVGLAVDVSRLYYVRSRVQTSLDAASLAAAKLLDDPSKTADDVQTLGEAYFQQNLGGDPLHGAAIKNFKAVADVAKGTVRTTVDVDLPTMFVQAGGGSLGSFTFGPAATSNYKTLRLEIAMVLDVTGSMGDPAADGSIKIDTLKTVAKDFIDSLYSNKPQPGFIRVGLAPYSGALNAGAKAFSLAGFGSDSCVVDRDGGSAYTDDVPTILSRLGRSSTAVQPGYFCPVAQFAALTDLLDATQRTNFKNKIDALSPGGGTAGHIGTAWGWYLLSPKWTGVWGSAAGQPYSNKVKKVVILLTDGMFNTAYGNGGAALDYATTGQDPLVPGSSPYQALKLCENIKNAAAGDSAVTIYTIGFATPPEAEATLKACSGASNFYPADSSSALLSAFRDIAKKLTNLRVSS
jgi:Flp pilus assembly protein TadG